jgi:PAS domain S-box-containing protein
MASADLRARAPRPLWKLWLWRAWTGCWTAGVALAIRAAIGVDNPGVVPFPVVFTAIVAATLIAGWEAGIVALLVGGSAAWVLFVRPYVNLQAIGVGSTAGIALTTLCAIAIVVLAERHRRIARDLRTFDRKAALERERMLGQQLSLLENTGSFMCILEGPELRCVYANRACRQLLGDDVIGKPVREIRPDAPPEAIETLERVKRRGQGEVVRGRRAVFGADEVRYLDFVFEPVRNEAGEVTGVFMAGHDVTDISRGRAALEETATRLRLATEAGGVGIWEWRLDTGEMIYSAEARAISGFAPDEEVTYDKVVAVTHPEDFPRTSAQARRATDPAIRQDAQYEYRIVRPGGEIRWVTANGHAVFETRGGDAVATRYIGTLIDITERKLAEERLQLLNREIDHRANNLLTVVQGTVQLSRADSAAALKETILGRLQALARAHQLLSDTRWSGADLRRLVEEEMLAFSLGEVADRVNIRGPVLELAPAAAQAVAMAMHELATNAAKHGALSRPDGRVSIEWRRKGSRLVIRWSESGGPPVAKPTRTGFGARLLARAFEGQFEGSTRLNWRTEGLMCEMELKLPTLEPSPPALSESAVS